MRKEGVDDGAEGHRAGPGAWLGRRQERLEQDPFCNRQVVGIGVVVQAAVLQMRRLTKQPLSYIRNSFNRPALKSDR